MGGVYVAVAPAIIHNAMKIHVPQKTIEVSPTIARIHKHLYNHVTDPEMNKLIFIDEFRMAPPGIDKAIQQLLQKRFNRGVI